MNFNQDFVSRITFYKRLSESDRNKTQKLFDSFRETGYSDVIRVTKRLKLGGVYEINWACIWNKPEDIEKKCLVIAQDDKVAIVSIEGKNQAGVYRHNDLTFVTMPKIKK